MIIFTDLDGTLEDSRLDMAEAVNRVRKQFGLPTRETIALFPLVNRGMDELYKSCFDDLLLASQNYNQDLERVRLAYEADYLSNVANQTRLYDGIAEVLPKLATLGKLVLVTNKPEHISDALLNKLNVRKYYDIIMGGDSCPETKPSPLPLKIAAARLGGQNDPAFMIGDSVGDLKTAKAYGARSIWCSWGYLSAIPDGISATASAHHPSELFKLCQLM